MPTTRFENPRPCGLCQNTVFETLPNPRLAHLCRCATCGLVQARTFPDADALRKVYREEYFKSADSASTGYDDYERDRYCILKTAARRLDTIERFSPTRGHLLDVGCALGFFLEEAKSRGWQVDGVDISEHAVKFANERLGIPARVGMLEEAGYEPGSFDVVTMWDVIEHVPAPVSVLSLARTLLKPGGLLVLSTPDVGSTVAKLTGARWMGFKLAEEHLYYFSRKTVTLALEKGGYQPLEVTSIGKDVALDFLARRLRMYVPPLAAVLGKGVEVMGLDRAAVYVNPRDILCAVARRRD
ncbi:MAG: class I SAM-dependent methyltransferase [Chloroflexi bacterium]|nr:class I SAM-dependent methyltransferase [Chloroflexota bacterium]